MTLESGETRQVHRDQRIDAMHEHGCHDSRVRYLLARAGSLVQQAKQAVSDLDVLGKQARSRAEGANVRDSLDLLQAEPVLVGRPGRDGEVVAHDLPADIQGLTAGRPVVEEQQGLAVL